MIGLAVLLYQFMLLVTVILTTIIRYRVQIDGAGITLLVFHFLLHAGWLYSMTLSVNLLAIWIGSSASFLTVVGMQIACITLLGSTDTILNYLNNFGFRKVILNLNPITHLVLGWHSSSIESVDKVLNPPYKGLNLNTSLLLIIAFFSAILLLGGVFIKRHYLLISDSEMGGF